MANGELKLKAGEQLDFATEQTVSLDITTTDNAGKSYKETFTLTVMDDPGYPAPNSAARLAISGEARSGQTLIAVLEDSNGVPDNVQYQWHADGVAISGATGKTFVPDWQQIGKTLEVRATYTDSAGYAETPSSPATAAVTYGIHTHGEYGRYIDARDFGADPAG